ncbi:MAG: hypothetical protein KDC48_01340 [Planctomycetes bacterium]|nr:hypothetical protein [Planctomycetota bacterium]
MRPASRLLPWLLGVAIGAPAVAQVQLVRDIRQVSPASNGSSAPSSFRDAGARAYFLATAFGSGLEPYVTDGTPAGTRCVADFRPGASSSDPTIVAVALGAALLHVHPAAGQHEFVLTDGTAPGTTSLGTLGLGDDAYMGARLGNGKIILQRGTGNLATCFATDLTTAGTVALPALTGFRFALEHNGLAYGFGNTTPGGGFGYGGFDLCVTDGTPAGSRVVATNVMRGAPIYPGSGLVVFGGRIYFLRSVPGAIEIGSTDGTVAGTTNHGAIAGLSSSLQVNSELLLLGNQLAFLADASLWIGNGTGAGTARVAGMPCDTLSGLVEHQGRLYFSAVGTTMNTGFELFSSDGTAAGTALVAEIQPGGGNGAPRYLVPSAQGVWFLGAPSSTSTALYLCNGPQSLQQIGSPLPTGLPPLVPFQNGLLLSVDDGAIGFEPYFATAAQGVTLLGDLRRYIPGIDPQTAARGRDRLFFCAADDVHGRELWSTDGTAAGTTMVDFTPGTASTFLTNGDSLVSFGDGVAAVTSRNANYGVLVSDGTAAGTHALPLPVNARGTAIGTRGDVLFVFDGQRLFRSDGTVAGTSPLPVLAPSPVTAPQLFVLPGALVFGGPSGGIFGTDGVASPVQLSVLSYSYPMRKVGDRLVFADARGLLSTDGTLAGTTPLSPVFPLLFEGGDSDVLYFRDSASLYRTDGTPAGTVVVAPLPSGVYVETIVSTATGVFLLGSDLTSGRELYALDPQLGQIVLAVDLAPGPASGVVGVARIGEGDTLLLIGDDLASGREPWISDGTQAGTHLLADINQGPNGSNPGVLGIAAGDLYLLAEDDVVGRELRRVSLADVGAASVQRVVAGCAGGAGRPALDVTAAPRLGAAGFGYRLDGAVSSTLVGMLLGDQLGRVSLLGCDVAPAGGTASWLALTTVGGSATFALPLPNASELLGLQLTTQGFGLDPAVARGFSGSNAVFVVIGR